MVNMEAQEIISLLPYRKPFLFVDHLLEYNENGVTGTYMYHPEHEFYKGHFAEYPVTPGAILTETMAQIGVVCLGIYLIRENTQEGLQIALTSADTEYLKPVYPGETVTVTSEKSYFRFGKLRCRVVMKNAAGQEVCRGNIAGIITNR